MTQVDALSASFLTALGSAALRSVMLAAFAGVLAASLGRRRNSVTQCVWRIVLIAALAMPLLDATLPSVPLRVMPALNVYDSGARPTHNADLAGITSLDSGQVRALPRSASAFSSPSISNERTMTASTSAAPRRQPMSWPFTMLIVYLIGVITLLARAVVGGIAKRRFERTMISITNPSMIQRQQEIVKQSGLARCPRLVESEACVVPITTGIVNAAIVLPLTWREWTTTTTDAVLVHELSHVSRRDALTQALARLYRAIFWFSPLSWWLQRHLAQLAEYASDEAVLAGGLDRAEYAETLLRFFAALGRDRRRVTWQIAMAHGTGAERRINRILGWSGVSKVMTTWFIVVVASLAIPCVALVASVQLAERSIQQRAFEPPARETFVAAPMSAAATPAVRRNPAQPSTAIPPSNTTAAAGIPNATGRVVVVMIDDANIPFLDTLRLRELTRLTFNELKDGDVGSLVSTSSKISVEPTSDRSILLAAAMKLSGEGAATDEIFTAPESSGLIRRQLSPGFEHATLMLNQLRSVRGKEKLFIWITEGFDSTEVAAEEQTAAGATPKSFRALSDELAAAAKASGIVLFFLDPRALTGGVRQSDEWRDYVRNTQDSLRTVAILTGGGVAATTNDPHLDPTVARSTKDGVLTGIAAAGPGEPVRGPKIVAPELQATTSAPASWRERRAAMFAKLLSRAQGLVADVQVKVDIGIVAPLDASPADRVLAEIQHASKADRALPEPHVLSAAEISDTTMRFDAALTVATKASQKFAVGLTTTAEVANSLRTALTVLLPAAAGQSTPPDITARPSADRQSVDAVFPSTQGRLKKPEIIKDIAPKYTPEAIREKIQGTVELTAIIEKNGAPSHIQVTKSLDASYGLDEQAIAAFKEWRFHPGTLDDEPVRVQVHMELTFTLR